MDGRLELVDWVGLVWRDEGSRERLFKKKKTRIRVLRLNYCNNGRDETYAKHRTHDDRLDGWDGGVGVTLHPCEFRLYEKVKKERKKEFIPSDNKISFHF